MNRTQFEGARQGHWQRLRHTIDTLGKSRKKVNREDLKALPELHRRACRDLALAQDRMYGLELGSRLNELVQKSHRLLYRRRAIRVSDALDFVVADFPRAVRANAGLFAMCTGAFLLPFVVMIIAGSSSPAWTHSILGSEGMEQMDMMYGPGTSHDDLRADGESDLMMFGFYIMNNVGIDFRMFAGGIAFGVGALLFLVVNGLHMGAAAAYVHEYGSPEAFYGFVSGHSSFELIGMLVAGTAGMKMGLALLRPGRVTRRESLRRQSAEGVRLLYGAAGLTVVAAGTSMPELVTSTVAALRRQGEVEAVDASRSH